MMSVERSNETENTFAAAGCRVSRLSVEPTSGFRNGQDLDAFWAGDIFDFDALDNKSYLLRVTRDVETPFRYPRDGSSKEVQVIANYSLDRLVDFQTDEAMASVNSQLVGMLNTQSRIVDTRMIYREHLNRLVELRHDNLIRFLGFGRVSVRLRTGFIGENKVAAEPYEYRALLEQFEPVHQWFNLSEWLFGGDRTETVLMDTTQVVRYTVQLLDALSYLHGLHPAFIVANLNSYGVLMAQDRSHVKIWNLMYGALQGCGVALDLAFRGERYAHRDVLMSLNGNHQAFKTHVDIWSLGCVVLDMVTQGNLRHVDGNGKLVRRETPKQTLIDIVIDGGSPYIYRAAPAVIREFCSKCFERNPKYFYTAPELEKLLRSSSEGSASKIYKDAKIDTGPSFVYRNGTTFEFYFECLDQLGAGTFGTVYAIEIIDQTNPHLLPREFRDKELALKVLRQDVQIPDDHRKVLLGIKHEHVVQFMAIGVLPRGSNNLSKVALAGLLMEKYDGGTLNSLAKKGSLNECDILKYVLQVVAGTRYLHGFSDHKPDLLRICHGDLKGVNILLAGNLEQPNSTGLEWTAKIGDLENYELIVENETRPSGLRMENGSLEHMSPEMLNYALRVKNQPQNSIFGTGIGRATDIWSIGCIALEMFGGGFVKYISPEGRPVKVNYANPEALLNEVRKGAHPDMSPALSRNINSKFRDNILACLNSNPKNRPKASELYNALVTMTDILVD